MSEKQESRQISVQSYAGYRGEESPRRFFLDKQTLEVVEVLNQWQEPDCRCFRVRADDGRVYGLRYDENEHYWELF